MARASTPNTNTVATDNVMMICPNLKCRKVLRVPGQFRGQHVRCHYCQTTFEVPAQKRDEAPLSPPKGKPAK
jgi:transposase-like protein